MGTPVDASGRFARFGWISDDLGQFLHICTISHDFRSLLMDFMLFRCVFAIRSIFYVFVPISRYFCLFRVIGLGEHGGSGVAGLVWAGLDRFGPLGLGLHGCSGFRSAGWFTGSRHHNRPQSSS